MLGHKIICIFLIFYIKIYFFWNCIYIYKLNIVLKNLIYWNFRSPERIEGKEYGVSSDIWSFGLMLIELTTG